MSIRDQQAIPQDSNTLALALAKRHRESAHGSGEADSRIKAKRDGPRHVIDPEEAQRRAREKEAKAQYGRGKSIPYKSAKDKKIKSTLRRMEEKTTDAAVRAKNAEILLENDAGFLEPEHELERTYRVRQDEIVTEVGVGTAKNSFNLKLIELGPYRADYTRNGSNILLAGRKGHVASLHSRNGELGCELQLKETVRDAKWLHNNQYFAVAQKDCVYIYDHAGVELHALKKLAKVTMMTFLPYHFLLASVSEAGYLKYHDTSIGHIVAEMRTKQGSPTSFAQNPSNAVVHVGHQNGQISLWTPNQTTPVEQYLAHRGPVRSISVDREGRYMVSLGEDQQMVVWDIRTHKKVNSYFTRRPGASVAVSDRGVTAVGCGTQVSMWRGLFDKAFEDQEKVKSPYLTWGADGQQIDNVTWCPFEDVLGIGHNKGFHSILVPGAGEPNFDATELNPYETVQQRQESEVKALLNKLQPEMISSNPNIIGSLDLASHQQRQKERDLDRPREDPIANLKNRGRGKNSSLRKHLRKKGSKNIVDENRMKIEKLRKETNATRRKDKLVMRKKEEGAALAPFIKN